MPQNHYAPPSSTVTDIDNSVPAERPRTVKIALVLCWISLAIALPILVASFDKETPDGEPPFSIALTSLFYVALFAFAILLILSIGRARNWARIVYAVLTGLSLLASFGSLSDMLAEPWYWLMAETLSDVVDLAIVVLLFRPASNAWFRTRGRRPADIVA